MTLLQQIADEVAMNYGCMKKQLWRQQQAHRGAFTVKKLPSPSWPARSSVLIANKHNFLAKVIERICSKVGYAQVQTFCTADDILSALESVRFNLILIDENVGSSSLPEIPGLMREAPGAADAQIILTTTNLTTASAKQAKAAGADDILLKPFSPDLLMLNLSTAAKPKRQMTISSDLAWG